MIARWLGGTAAATVALVALVGLSQVPWTVTRDDRGLLRASWRVLGDHIEACRPATAEELARMAAHMRQTMICEEPRIAPYTLRIAVDGEVRVDGVAAGSGVPGDRPIYVLHESPLTPGPRRVSVAFWRSDRDSAASDSAALTPDSTRRVVPPRLLLDTTVSVAEREVILITYSAELRALQLLRRATTNPR
jgi:hypothetical protein